MEKLNLAENIMFFLLHIQIIPGKYQEKVHRKP